MKKERLRTWMIGLIAGAAAGMSGFTSATVVQFQTSLGDFEVNLYDETTPLTVQNFLSYIEAGAYADSIVHRSEPGFVVQGGGFQLLDETTVEPIETPWSPLNEPVYSNVRGTIAMAKLGGDPNSATSQWFINLSDNSQNLDLQNGGFTVFGQVTGDGMNVLDSIAALPRFNVINGFPLPWNQAFGAVPLRDGPEGVGFIVAMDEYFVLVENIVIIDAAPDTAAELERPLSLVADGGLPEEPAAPSPAQKRKKKSGTLGAGILLLLTGFAILGQRRRRY